MKYILFFLLVLFFSGCFNKDKGSYKKKYYPSGNLKSYGYYIKDSIPIDTLFTLSEEGKILSKEVYDKIGNAVKSTTYFKSGIISEEINYKQGLANGFAYVFAQSGTLSQKLFYFNDNKVGDAYFYDEIPNNIDRYGFYEWNGHNINLVKYDSVTGKRLKDMRQTIYLDSVKINTDTLDIKHGHFYDIILVISNPPKCRSTIKIDYFSKNGFIINSDSVTGKPCYFVKKLLPDSLFAIKFSGNQYDSLTQESYEQWNRKIVNK